MKTFGNFVWLLIGGLFEALSWVFIGVILCMTIIGIPWGKNCFKIASLAFAPFEKEVDASFDEHPVANLIWMMFIGWEVCLAYITLGAFFYLTIIGIPLGKQCFKMAKITMTPFGASVY